jgi:hypothetical protein
VRILIAGKLKDGRTEIQLTVSKKVTAGRHRRDGDCSLSSQREHSNGAEGCVNFVNGTKYNLDAFRVASM